jgi:hypothetical protein
VLGFGTVMAGTAWLAPSLLPALIGAFLAAACVLVAYRHLTAAWVGWLLVTGLSLEMALADLFGPAAFQPAIAAVKASEIGLVALTIIRAGVLPDRFNPAWAFAAMAVMGLVVGTHPNLTLPEATRSLIGDITPFLLFFCVKPPGWGAAVRRAVTLAPALSVILGAVLAVTGLRPVFFESGGLRLAGLGHPAFLAGVCLPAIYAGLIRWLRTASPREAALIGVNLAILVLTGARAPAAYAAVVMGGSLIFAPGSAIPRAHRLVLIACGEFERPSVAVAGIRGSGSESALVRLGARFRQPRDPERRSNRRTPAHPGRAQRISAHPGRGRVCRPHPADRAVRAVGDLAHAAAAAPGAGGDAAHLCNLCSTRDDRQCADFHPSVRVLRLHRRGLCRSG